MGLGTIGLKKFYEDRLESNTGLPRNDLSLWAVKWNL